MGKNKRNIFILVLVVAFVLILWHVLGSADRRQQYDRQGDVPLIHRAKDGDKTPEIVFAEGARTDDEQVNAFVEKFVDILVRGDYRAYRLNVSEMRDPLDLERFEKAYRRVESVTVQAIEPAPDAPLPQPAWKVSATVHLPHKRTQQIQVFIFKEDGRWVSSN